MFPTALVIGAGRPGAKQAAALRDKPAGDDKKATGTKSAEKEPHEKK